MIIMNDGNIGAGLLKNISKAQMSQENFIDTFRSNNSARNVEGWITFSAQWDKKSEEEPELTAEGLRESDIVANPLLR